MFGLTPYRDRRGLARRILDIDEYLMTCWMRWTLNFFL